jgi:hypothetical protein
MKQSDQPSQFEPSCLQYHLLEPSFMTLTLHLPTLSTILLGPGADAAADAEVTLLPTFLR